MNQSNENDGNVKNLKQPFVTNVQELRRRAREHIEKGAVTEKGTENRETVLKLLNEALATELVCVLRYRYHYFAADGIHSASVAEEFLEHSNEEQEHADMIANRIIELDGDPNFNPEGLHLRSLSEYKQGANLQDMIKEDLIAERIAIDSYRDIIRYIGLTDPTTRRMLEEILATEEEHAEEMASLLENVGGSLKRSSAV